MRARFRVVPTALCLAPHALDSPIAGAGTQQETSVPRRTARADLERAPDGPGAVVHDMQAHARLPRLRFAAEGPLRCP